MRRVASGLGMATMSLYNYVPAKVHLLDTGAKLEIIAMISGFATTYGALQGSLASEQASGRLLCSGHSRVGPEGVIE